MEIKHRREIFIFGMVAMDTVLITFAFSLAFWIRDNFSLFGSVAGVGSPQNYTHIYPVILFSWLTILSLMHQYEPRRRWGIGEIFISVFIAVSLGTLFILAYSYGFHHIQLSRLLFLYMWVISFVFLITLRLFIRKGLIWLGSKGKGIKRIIMVGWGEAALTLAEEYKRHPETLYSVSGVVIDKTQEKDLSEKDLWQISLLTQKGILGNLGELKKIAKEEKAHFVIIASFLPREKVKRFIEELSAEDIIVRIVPDIFEFAPRNMEFYEIGNVPVISFRDIPMQGWEAVAKRILDIIGSIIGLIIVLPLFAVVGILIKKESPGPVFFSQDRIGQNGKPFRMYKFRSMRQEAAKGPPVKVTGDFDPRVTKIGRFIRKTSIDELPQLFNVLKGDMSLVGPRPETYLYVSQYTDWNKRRLYLRPGLTGLAQSLGVRGDTTIDEKTKHDLEYMRNQSFWLDIKILFMTAVNLFRQKEAY